MERQRIHAKAVLRPYTDSDWNSLLVFIASQWGTGHPMTDRRLFEWQFRGFGQARHAIQSLLLFIDGELAGFRGIIPGLYQVPSARGMEILPGGSLAMWMLRKEFRGLGLGRLMHSEAERLCPVLSGAGSNPETSVPVYLKSGFRVLEAMNRYLAVLDPGACLARFGPQSAAIPPAPEGETGNALGPSRTDPHSLAEIWRGSACSAGFFSLYRDEEFWRWRILESPGFRYEVFLDPGNSGFVTARLERLVSPERQGDCSPNVFRIIDLVPASPATWLGSEDRPFIRFLGRCLDWAREAGSIAADFHCSSSIFGSILQKAGFFREQDLLEDGVPPLPRLFNGGPAPGRPINALVKAFGIDSFERVYMVKSDNDMDRPRRLDENGQVLY
jgi:GNAT superfamily N-acetyltransferase